MKRILSLIIAVCLCLSCIISIAEEYNYSLWAEEYCIRAFELGWIDENIPKNFKKDITREEFCILAGGALMTCTDRKGSEAAEEGPFTDTVNSSVLALYNEGIVNGRSNTAFAPNDLITREEAAGILERICTALDISTELMYDMAYTDDAEISPWARNAVYKVTTLGIMQGTQTGFEPKGNITTEQAITALVRVYEKALGCVAPATFEDKLNTLMPRDENYMFSPLSIKLAFALAANGAGKEVKDEIVQALNLKDLDSFNSYAKEIIELYNLSETIELNIANSIWVNKSRTDKDFSGAFTSTAKEFYLSDTDAVSADKAVQTINQWVSDKTRGKIDSIIDNNDFYAMIVNAIYFNGGWMKEFRESATAPDEFTSMDGSVKEIDFMNQTDWFSYCRTDNSRIVKLPYKRSYIQLPDSMEEKAIELGMYILLSDGEICVKNELGKAENKYSREYVKLSIPKFEIECSTSLKDKLTDIGVEKAFSHGLTSVLDGENMFIDDAMHKTYIRVDEKGTEAAAVTGIKVGATGLRELPEPVEFKADRPFDFVIRDDISGEILFMGRYAYAK